MSDDDWDAELSDEEVEEEGGIVVPDDEDVSSAQQSQLPAKYRDMTMDQLKEAIIELEKAVQAGGKPKKVATEDDWKHHEEELARLEASAPKLSEEEERARQVALKREIEEREEQDIKKAFGGNDDDDDDDDDTSIQIEAMQPSTKKEFASFATAITRKVKKYDQSPHFEPFLIDLFKGLCSDMDSGDIRTFTGHLNVLSNEKSKAEKSKKKGGKKKKSANKPSLSGGKGALDSQLSGFADEFDGSYNDDGDDYDFM